MSVVLPSYMTVNDFSEGATESLTETTLRLGEVTAAYAPNAPENKDPATHGKQWVYDVAVTYRDADGARFVVPYRCTVMDTFGGLADHFRHTVRQTSVPTDAPFGNGAQVLVLCPNGDKSNALIVGGERHRDTKDVDPNTTFLDFVFNGVHISIDKDGSMKLQVPGATSPDGSPDPGRDSNNHGTQVTFAKDGGVLVEDQNGQSVRIKPGGQSVEVTGKHVTIFSDDVQVGGDNLTPQENGAVFGGGIDTFTGLTYYELQNASKHVKVKK